MAHFIPALTSLQRSWIGATLSVAEAQGLPAQSWEVFKQPFVFERSIDDSQKLTSQRDDRFPGPAEFLRTTTSRNHNC
jgi:hypothetical protein